MKYQIIQEAGLMSLHKTVNDEIEKGWKPLGGVSFTIDRKDNYYYLQAMIKE